MSSTPTQPESTGVQRFDPQIAGATEEGFLPMDETVDGDWVRFEDYEKVREHRDRADEEVGKLEDALRRGTERERARAEAAEKQLRDARGELAKRIDRAKNIGVNNRSLRLEVKTCEEILALLATPGDEERPEQERERFTYLPAIRAVLRGLAHAGDSFPDPTPGDHHA